MKLVNNNISPLPFYDNLALQNHRKDYAYGQVYPLITYKNMLLPFQVVLASGTSVNWVRLYDFNTGKYTDITTNMKENGLTLKSYTDFKVLKYPGTLPIIQIKHEGQYYLAISVSGLGTIYSDVFTVCNKVDDYLFIEYSNSYNFELKNGVVDFSDGFKFRCYLNTQVGKPEYDFEEEATDRMGYTFIESQVSKKIYKFVFLAPEYLCDALRIVRLCENKQITSKLQTYDLTTFNMEPEWEDQGDLASVACEFETDTVIANIGGYTPELVGGDFNSDFDTDFYDIQKLNRPITINISCNNTANIILEATPAVKSNLNIYVKYRASLNIGGTEEKETNIVFKKGLENDNIYLSDLAGKGWVSEILEASVTSKEAYDSSIYNINLIND